MRDGVEVARYVSLNGPLVGLACTTGQSFADVGHGVIDASIWPESIRVLTKVCFPYWFEDHPQGFLYNPIAYAGDPLSTLPLFPSYLWNM